MQVDVLQCRAPTIAHGGAVVGRVTGKVIINQQIAGDRDRRGVIVRYLVVVHFHVTGGQHQDAGSRWHRANHASAYVIGVVVVGLVVKNTNIAAVGLIQPWQVEHQDAARVCERDVVVHIRHGGVFNLNAGHVLFGGIVPNHNVFGLPHVDARIRRPEGVVVLQQHVLAFQRVQSVGAVGRLQLAFPDRGGIGHMDTVDVGGLDAVLRRLVHPEVPHRNAIPALEAESVVTIGRAEIQRSFIDAVAGEGQPAGTVDDNALRHHKPPFWQNHHGIFRQIEQRYRQRLGNVITVCGIRRYKDGVFRNGKSRRGHRKLGNDVGISSGLAVVSIVPVTTGE